MKNIKSKLAIVLAATVLLSAQIYASEEPAFEAETEMVKGVQCMELLNKESKLSNLLHSLPLISKIFNRRVNIDYVAEDVLLTNYMLGTPAEIAKRQTEKSCIVEEDMLTGDLIAESEMTEDFFGEYLPVAFAAELEEESVVEECSESEIDDLLDKYGI